MSAELDRELAELRDSGRVSASAEHVVENILAVIGQGAPRESRPDTGDSGPGGSHIAEVVMNLAPFFDRGRLSSAEIRDRWREKVGSIPDALELTYISILNYSAIYPCFNFHFPPALF